MTNPIDMVKNWLTGIVNGLSNYDYVPSKSKPAKKKKPPFKIPSETASWHGIVFHHSQTADGKQSDNWSAIKRYHVNEKKWSAIGYHLGIEFFRGKLSVRMGRSWKRAGAHAGFKGNNTFNKKYLGICLIGNFDKEAPTDEQMKLCAEVARHIMGRFNIPKDKVLGHREVYDKVGVPRKKTCPGTLFNIDKLRGML